MTGSAKSERDSLDFEVVCFPRKSKGDGNNGMALSTVTAEHFLKL
jgi:hypothetical protein